MFKIVSISVIGLVLLGCNANPKVSHSMFQSVSKEEAVFVMKTKDKKHCARCGMDLAKYYKTNHSAKIGKTTYQYCSIHCLEDHLGDGVVLKNPQVVDVKSLKFISIKDAYYVVGSSKRGTMSKVSKYAFLSLEEAKKFQKNYGGKIVRFNGALEEAKKDFRYYK